MNCAEHALVEFHRRRVSIDLELVACALEVQRKNCAILSVGELLDDAIGALLSLTFYYKSLYDMGDSDLVDLSRHLQTLIGGLRNSYLDLLGVRVDRQFDTVLVRPPVARDLGIIVVDLVANAAEHAVTRRGSRICVELRNTRAGLICRVTGDGCGPNDTTLGREAGVAKEVAARLGGFLDMASSPRGATFTVGIPWSDEP